ncbi:MAG: SpoIID/LytB domain-containing protein [Planctomycetota bacterium]|jgi:stage II sporulation protein D
MRQRTDNHHRRRRRFAAAAVCFCAVAAAAMAGLGGCQTESPLRRYQPVTRQGVPVVRVLLTGRPVEQVAIGAVGGYRLLVDGRTISESTGDLDAITVTRRGGMWRLNGMSVPGRSVALRADAQGATILNEAIYRGELHLSAVDEKRIRVVNHVDVESYLAGVLPKEIYPNWSAEAYRAQAVAARSFALYHRATFGKRHDWDLGDSEASQVYGGAGAETPKAWRAVQSTHAQTLAYGSAGAERAFLVQYSSSCGGTVNGARVIRPANDIAPLQGGQTCTDCRRSRQYRWPPVRISKADIYAALMGSYPAAKSLGGVKRIRVRTKTDYGRAEWIDVIGPNRKKLTIRGEDLRLAVLRSGAKTQGRLYSMNCTLRDLGDAIEFSGGRGHGHGVGMCQWGAQGKAKRGWTAEQILSFYYPGSTLIRQY